MAAFFDLIALAVFLTLLLSSSAVADTLVEESWTPPVASTALPPALNASFFQVYRTLDEIRRFVDYMSSAAPSALPTRTLTVAGRTTEGREIRVLSLSAIPADERPSRGVFVLSGVHPREWVALTAGLFAAYSAVRDYGQPGHEVLTASLQNSALHFAFLANPDGYEKSWSNVTPTKADLPTWEALRKGLHSVTREHGGLKPPPEGRLWRRNLGRPFPVDLNRNWGKEGLNWRSGSDGPQSINYPGPAGFSEPETQALARYLRSSGVNAFLDLHCCGSGLRAPYSLLPALPPKHRAASTKAGIAIAKSMSKVKKISKFAYQHRFARAKNGGPAACPRGGCVGGGTGMGVGFAYTELGLDHSYTIEIGRAFCTAVFRVKRYGEEVYRGVRTLLTHAATATISPRIGAFFPNDGTEDEAPTGLKASWRDFLCQQSKRKNHAVDCTEGGSQEGAKLTKAFQRRHGLVANGIVDERSLYVAAKLGFRKERWERLMSPPAQIRLESIEGASMKRRAMVPTSPLPQARTEGNDKAPARRSFAASSATSVAPTSPLPLFEHQQHRTNATKSSSAGAAKHQNAELASETAEEPKLRITSKAPHSHLDSFFPTSPSKSRMSKSDQSSFSASAIARNLSLACTVFFLVSVVGFELRRRVVSRERKRARML